MPASDRGGRFSGSLIKSSRLDQVPAAIPDEEAPASSGPSTVPDPEPPAATEVEEQRPRTRRKPPVNVRLRITSAAQFQEGYLEEKAQDLDLSITDYASDLIEEALAARRRERKP